MHSYTRCDNSSLGPSWSRSNVVLAFLFSFLTLMQSAQGQTYRVIYNFTGNADGAFPYAGLTIDQAGNLYGTAFEGGYLGGDCAVSSGCGVAYQLSRRGAGWSLSLLHTFVGGNADGAYPWTRVVIGPQGDLYGTTFGGGCDYGCGTVFKLSRPPTAAANAVNTWRENIIHRFNDGQGYGPALADLNFDGAGNIYGTTVGAWGQTVFELTPSGGEWTFATLYQFLSAGDGGAPYGGVVPYPDGKLYGTTFTGGSDVCSYESLTCGTFYELSPSQNGWTETVLYEFRDKTLLGGFPTGGLLLDHGNLYGSTTIGGASGGGTVFMMSPPFQSPIIMWSLSGDEANGIIGPWANLTMDQQGNLYGTTYQDGSYGMGTIFKISPTSEGWNYTSLHEFSNCDDGCLPTSNVIMDNNGHLYGTASNGGAHGSGVVWEITP